MKQFMLLILCFPLMFGAVPSDSAPVDLTAAEEAALGGGEIVIRNVPSDSGGFVVGVVDIQASPEKVWESTSISRRVSRMFGALRRWRVTIAPRIRSGWV